MNEIELMAPHEKLGSFYFGCKYNLKIKKNITKLEETLKIAVQKIVEKYEKATERARLEQIKPKRSDIKVKMVELAWYPYWVIKYKEKGISRITTLEAFTEK